VPSCFTLRITPSRPFGGMSLRETVIHADEASHWDSLHARYQTKAINHSEAYTMVTRARIRLKAS